MHHPPTGARGSCVFDRDFTSCSRASSCAFFTLNIKTAVTQTVRVFLFESLCLLHVNFHVFFSAHPPAGWCKCSLMETCLKKPHQIIEQPKVCGHPVYAPAVLLLWRRLQGFLPTSFTCLTSLSPLIIFLVALLLWRAAQVLTTQGLVTHSSHFSFLFFCKNITVWFTTGPSLGSYFETSVTASCFPTGSLGAVLVLLSIISSGNFSFHLRHVGLQLVLLWKRCSLRI